MIHLDDFAPGVVALEPKIPSGIFSYHEAIDSYRREVILHTLARTEGNRAEAARILGLERSYLLKLIKSLHIS
jgi:DNA-binding NtrC family response regulator